MKKKDHFQMDEPAMINPELRLNQFLTNENLVRAVVGEFQARLYKLLKPAADAAIRKIIDEAANAVMVEADRTIKDMPNDQKIFDVLLTYTVRQAEAENDAKAKKDSN